MNPEQRVESLFAANLQAVEKAMTVLVPVITQAGFAMRQALDQGGRILACGNGGSAADAQHFSAELLNRFEIERAPLAGIALTTDASTLTAIGNDYSFDEVFVKQIQAIGRRGDILLAISTSGHSNNIMRAIQAAQSQAIKVVALTGKDGGLVGQILSSQDIEIRVPNKSTARIQEVHGLIIHCLCDLIDQNPF